MLKGYAWGMKYDNVVQKLHNRGNNFVEDNGDHGKYIVCKDYNIILSQIGISDGFETYFYFNGKSELYRITLNLTEKGFLQKRYDGIIKNQTDFLSFTNMEWSFLQKRYGQETFKTMPDFSKKNIEQKILWAFDDGAIEIYRQWVGTNVRCVSFSYKVIFSNETYE